MFSAIEKIKTAYQLNPAAIQAKAIKWLACVGVLALMLFITYSKGVANTNAKWEAKIEKQRTTIAQTRANNAVDAGKRLRTYTRTEADLEAAARAASDAVHAYYANNPAKPMIVEKTKLVQVPGQQEYVYVPIDSCPNSFFNADELRLWNQGAAGYGTDTDDTK